ncbi:hypothetical protein EII20_14110 [Comamonadaceae bacterium OH2545_COT-014]|nr:hypothetical protein EII20_14110 [Comamonadaceae bacterium OH2545_COT-014]
MMEVEVRVLDVVCEDFEGGLDKVRGNLFNLMINFDGKELLGIFESYIDCMNMLNLRDVAKLSSALDLCSDCMDFYNFRAYVIMRGRDVFNRILSGCGEIDEGVKFIVSSVNRLEDDFRSSMIYAYLLKTGRSLIMDSCFYDDKLFVSVLMNDFFVNKNMGGTGMLSDVLGGSVVHEAAVDGIGLVRQGDFIRHKKFGIAWLYMIVKDPLCNFKALAVFKDSMRDVLLGLPGLWSGVDFMHKK